MLQQQQGMVNRMADGEEKGLEKARKMVTIIKCAHIKVYIDTVRRCGE